MRQVPTLLRLEGLTLLVGATAIYWVMGASWLLFLVLFFAPDLFMLGYLRGDVVGARIYNAGHTYLLPGVLIGTGMIASIPVLVTLGLIWTAHIGLDRMLGFGLKLPTGFGDTHLQA